MVMKDPGLSKPKKRGAVVQWLARPLVPPAAGVRFPDQGQAY